MNWKQVAVDRLRQYEGMRNAVFGLPRELSRLRVEAFRVQSGWAEDRLLNNIVRRQELSAVLEQAREAVSATDRALQCLNRRERLILQRMYIYPEKGAAGRLCNELGLGRSVVYRNRDHALRKFALALYGALPS